MYSIHDYTVQVVQEYEQAVLNCTVLYCSLLYYIVLYCTLLYYTVLYSTVLYCTVQYCTSLHCPGGPRVRAGRDIPDREASARGGQGTWYTALYSMLEGSTDLYWKAVLICTGGVY